MSTKWAGFSQARRELLPAFKSTWLYTLTGLALGVALLLLGLPEGPLGSLAGTHQSPSLLAVVLEHLGIGFIVAAVAVFFYEWGAHTKKALKLSQRLEATLRRRLLPIAEAIGEAALLRGVDSLLGESSVGRQHVPEISRHIDGIARMLRKLQHGDLWCREEHIAYLADSLKLVSSNAECLASIDTEHPRAFRVLPEGLDPVDRFLSAQMRSLDRGDAYDVITDLVSWRPQQLTGLFEETVKAVKRKVAVRRIFNPLFPAVMEADEVRRILSFHLEESKKLGGKLDLKVLLPEDLDASSSDRLHEHARTSHFGIFRHGEQQLYLRFDIYDVSRMMMMTGPLEFANALFADAWAAAQPLTEDVIEKCAGLYVDRPAK